MLPTYSRACAPVPATTATRAPSRPTRIPVIRPAGTLGTFTATGSLVPSGIIHTRPTGASTTHRLPPASQDGVDSPEPRSRSPSGSFSASRPVTRPRPPSTTPAAWAPSSETAGCRSAGGQLQPLDLGQLLEGPHQLCRHERPRRAVSLEGRGIEVDLRDPVAHRHRRDGQ